MAPLKKTFGIAIVQNQVRGYREGASTLSKQSDPGWITTELGDVFLDPLHGSATLY